MPSLWALAVASFLAALGITLLIAAAVSAPLRCDVSRRVAAAGVAISGIAAFSAGVLVAAGLGLAALADAGIALSVAAGVVAILRARPGDDGGWGGGGDGGPPQDPDPTGGDWEEFEKAFWEYVERQPVA
ncbi:MAG TPA: hypothetical protein VFZ00_20600 [Solirubrobacter sp.]|nr:hypothetical protein [Solirubrobacter sp.]